LGVELGVWKPLHRAALHRHGQAVALLLLAGADPNAVSCGG
jgi:ankyrin repeat protein